VQHVAESHVPEAHTVLAEFEEYPAPQVKPAQVVGGVVVTVVMMIVQHVALQQWPMEQTVFAGFAE